MVKIAIYKHSNGRELAIYRKVNGDLLGKVTENGVVVSSNTFKAVSDKNTERCVCEHFGFPLKAWWQRHPSTKVLK